MASPEHMAMHQGSTPFWSLAQAVDGYMRHGFRAMSVRREKLAEHGLAPAARLLKDAGMTVLGLSGLAPMTASEADKRAGQRDTALRMIEEAAAVGARFIVVTGGPLPTGSKDLAAGRSLFRDMLADILPQARQAGIEIAIEPLSPMVAGENSCLNTMAGARQMCADLGPGTGIAVDAYHVWWDPSLEDEIAQCGRLGLLTAFHICDWRVPTRDRFQDRAMMGDGIIDLPRMERAMRAAGFSGFNEVEIFSVADWWTREPEEYLSTCAARHQTAV